MMAQLMMTIALSRMFNDDDRCMDIGCYRVCDDDGNDGCDAAGVAGSLLPPVDDDELDDNDDDGDTDSIAINDITNIHQ